MDFQQRLQMTALQFIPFIFAIVFHEVGHGWVAKRWGDNTASEQGRLTLNPIPHIHPLGTIAFPLLNMLTGIPLMIGWANPVPIDPRRFRKYRPGLFWTSVGGPGANFLLAAVSALLYVALELYMPKDFYLTDPLVGMAAVSVQINFALGIFNLIPLPPLDGSRIVESQLSYNANQQYQKLGQYSFFILMALMWTGGLSFLGAPINFLSIHTINLAAKIFGA